MTGRGGYRTPAVIAGDRSDLAGFPRLIDEFCEHMAACGYSERTVGNRRHMLSHLVAWLAERGITRPAEVTRPVLESHQRWLFHYRKADGQPLSFRSQSQRLLAVRAFFKWAAWGRHVLHNPASEIELPKAGPRLLRPALTVAEAEMVLAQPDLADPVGVRDWAIPEVFYSTGIRRSELAHLAVTDIDHERQTLLVRQGKGKKAGAADRGGVGGRGLRSQKRRRGLSPGNDLHGRASHRVSAGERRCREPSQPGIVAGACVAAEDTGSNWLSRLLVPRTTVYAHTEPPLQLLHPEGSLSQSSLEYWVGRVLKIS